MPKTSTTQKKLTLISTMSQTSAAATIGINQDGSQATLLFLQKQILSQES